MLKKLRSILHWIVTGSFTLLISACYGIPYDYSDITVTTVDDGNSLPIPDLQVTLHTNQIVIDSQTTDTSGRVFFPAEQNGLGYEIIVDDIDGATNGTYISKTNHAYVGQDIEIRMN